MVCKYTSIYLIFEPLFSILAANYDNITSAMLCYLVLLFYIIISGRFFYFKPKSFNTIDENFQLTATAVTAKATAVQRMLLGGQSPM